MRFACMTAALIAIGSPAIAADTMPAERRLTPEQVEAVLAEAAAKKKAAATTESVEETAPRAPQVHGEMGLAIGTGGYRSMYGTALYPIGENGMAAISFDMTDFGNRRYRR